MKKQMILLCVFVIRMCTAQYNAQNLKLEEKPLTAQHAYKNLQLFPIKANQNFIAAHENLGNYLSLEEALGQKKVRITEYSGGTVNTLFIENISKDTVMVLSGEVVQGGKQDRVIAQDFLLSPYSGKKDISVFCVEHGRWSPKRGGDMSFNQYFDISSNEVRKAATVAKDQQQVWEKVAETVKANEATTSTGTLTSLNDSKKLGEDLDQYKNHFATFSAQEDVIGVIAVSGDKIMGCDLFATHAIFVKHFPNLISSYATQAITSGKAVNISYDKVEDYLKGIINDENKQDENVNKKGTMMKNRSKKIHISTF